VFYRRLPEKIGRVEREGGDQLKNAPLKAIIGLYSFRVNCQDPFKGRWAVLFSLGFHSHSRDPRSLSIRFNLQSQRILILTQPSPDEILQIFLEKFTCIVTPDMVVSLASKESMVSKQCPGGTVTWPLSTPIDEL